MTWSMKVPRDAQENGVEAWEEMLQGLRDKYDMPDVPPYYVVMFAAYQLLIQK